MKTPSIKKIVLLICLLLSGIFYAQVDNKPQPFKLSEMTEQHRRNKIEEITMQALRDNMGQIKQFYIKNPEKLPKIGLGLGENYLRSENIEKQIWKEEHMNSVRIIYEGVITDRTLNAGDILYMTRYTQSKYHAWPITYTVLIFDDGKPICIGFQKNYHLLMIYENDTVPIVQPTIDINKVLEQ